MKIILRISLTLNIISAILFFIIYRFGFKGLKRKIENATLDLMDIDTDFFNDLSKRDIKGVEENDYQSISDFSKSLYK